MPLHTSDDDFINDDQQFVQNWSSDVASPRIQKQQKNKSKSLSRLDSVPKYIQRERALDQAVSHTGLASVASTPDGDRARPLSELHYESEASSILFEPLSKPTSRDVQSTDSMFDTSGNQANDVDVSKSSPHKIKPTSTKRTASSPTASKKFTPMQPVNGFQAMHNSLDQILLNSPTSSTSSNGGGGKSPTFSETPRSGTSGKSNKTAPAAPLRRSKIGGKLASSGAINLASSTNNNNNNSPKIQNAIEPKYTNSDSAQTIKTPILKRSGIDDEEQQQQQQHQPFKTASLPPMANNRKPSKLTKSNVLRHSFHHGTRPSLDYAQSLG